MAESNYKGESWSKKQARGMFWQEAAWACTRPLGQVVHPAEQERTHVPKESSTDVLREAFDVNLRHARQDAAQSMSRVLYLASSEGGDAAVLSCLGVPVGGQLAVDADSAALSRFSERYPGIPTALGFVADVLKARPPDALDCAFLDYCGPLTTERLAEVLLACRAVRVGGVVGVNVLKGRDVDQPEGNRAYRRRVAGQHSGSAAKELTLAALSGRDGFILGNEFLRAHRVLEYVKARSQFIGKYACSFSQVQYHSGDGGRGGSPMLTMLFRVRRVPKFRRGRRVQLTINEDHGSWLVRNKSAHAEIRRLVVLCGADPRFYNLSSAQVAAWRAVATRQRRAQEP